MIRAKLTKKSLEKDISIVEAMVNILVSQLMKNGSLDETDYKEIIEKLRKYILKK